MQQLTIEHKEKSSISNQIVDKESTRDRRFAKSILVAVSCDIIRLDNEKETYKVQSERDTNKYYIVKFIDGTPVYCSCKDFEIQSQKNRNHICKHQRAIVLAENYGLVGVTKQQISKSQNIEPSYSSTTTTSSSKKKQESKSYKDDDYSF